MSGTKYIVTAANIHWGATDWQNKLNKLVDDWEAILNATIATAADQDPIYFIGSSLTYSDDRGLYGLIRKIQCVAEALPKKPKVPTEEMVINAMGEMQNKMFDITDPLQQDLMKASRFSTIYKMADSVRIAKQIQANSTPVNTPFLLLDSAGTVVCMASVGPTELTDLTTSPQILQAKPGDIGVRLLGWIFKNSKTIQESGCTAIPLNDSVRGYYKKLNAVDDVSDKKIVRWSPLAVAQLIKTIGDLIQTVTADPSVLS